MIATISQALQRGDVSAALSAAQAFAVSDAQNPQAHQWLSICLQRSGDIAGARAAQLNRYASRTSIGNIAAKHPARVLSAGGEAGNAAPNRRRVPVGASHSTLSVSARAPE